MPRDYDAVIQRLSNAGDRDERMARVADAIWDVLSQTGVSWVGFYLDCPDQPDDRRLVLGPHRDTPACSPIGLHGMCGRALVEGRCQTVDDVGALGDAYIACDPRDRSEIVLPLACGASPPWGVLDLDSREIGAFDAGDASGLRRVLNVAGLV